MKKFESLIMATLIFLGCLGVGFGMATHRALWNDEYYSQVSSVYGTSYKDQFLGHIPEGGNAPLFYTLQKLFLQVIHYQVPTRWLQSQWSNDAASQMILRINPVVFMSLSVGLVFYYFCRRYSWGIGLYSLFIYLSAYMLWAYWAEARPYALVVFLTTVQSVILLQRMDQQPHPDQDRAWLLLAGTNVLLSMTSILCLGEIAAVSILWWVLKERDWKKYLLLTVIPIGITLFYYAHAPKYPFFFGSLSPEQLIRDNVSRQNLDIVFIFLFFLATYGVAQRNTLIRYSPSKEILKPMVYLIFLGLVLAFTGVLLWLFSLRATPGKGFPITSRYFIYLTPIGVMATTILSVTLIKSLSQYRVIQGMLVLLFGFLLVQHCLKNVPKAIHGLLPHKAEAFLLETHKI